MSKLILPVACILCGSQFCEARYSINGSLKMSYRVGPAGSFQEFSPITYSVLVDGCESSVSLRDTTKEPPGMVYSTFDGETRLQWTGKEADVNAVVISSEHVPYYAPYPHLPIIWMASMSGCYFAEGLVTSMQLPYGTEVVRRSLKVVFEEEKRSGIPKKWLFIEDSGQTNGVFTVERSTSIEGSLMPTRYTLLVYGSSPDGGRKVVFKCEGEQLVELTDQRVTTTPGLASSAYNHDIRFVSPDTKQKYPFVYHTNRILSVDEVRSLPGFPNYLVVERMTKDQSGMEKRAGVEATKGGAYRWLGWSLVSASGVFLLFFLARNAGRANKNKKGITK